MEGGRGSIFFKLLLRLLGSWHQTKTKPNTTATVFYLLDDLRLIIIANKHTRTIVDYDSHL